MRSEGERVNEPSYPLVERALDLFLDPSRLFEALARGQPATGAVLTGMGVLVAGSAVFQMIAEDPLPAWLGVVAGLVAALGSCLYLAVVALTGLAFGGLVKVDVPFGRWFTLAAHCSLVGVLALPAQLAVSLWSGRPDVQLGPADLLASPIDGFWRAFLSHLTLGTLGLLTLFGLGAASFTGSARSKALGFVFGLWIALWFMAAWLMGTQA